MHFDIEATSKRDPTVFSIIDYAFLRNYQPHQINTLFRYIPCTKRRASGNLCQPQTGTQASKKADLIISSSWWFNFYISFENLVTFTRCTDNVILEYVIFAIISICFGWRLSICKSVAIFKTTAICIYLSCILKWHPRKEKFLTGILHMLSRRTKIYNSLILLQLIDVMLSIIFIKHALS